MPIDLDALLAPAYQAAAEVTSPEYWQQQAYSIAEQHAAAAGLDPTVFAQVFVRQMQQESGLNPYVKDSSAGARGIAQLMPMHWQDVDPTDPIASLNYAANMMTTSLQQYGGDYEKALASYNWGSGNVQSVGYLSGDAFYSVLPDETKNYLNSILSGVQITPPDTGTGGDMPPLTTQTPVPGGTPTPQAGGNSLFGGATGKTAAPQQPRAQTNLPPGVFFDPSLPGYVYRDPTTGQTVPYTPDPTGQLDPTSPYNQHQAALAGAETQNAATAASRLALDARNTALQHSIDLINSLKDIQTIDQQRQDDEKKNILAALPYTSQGNQPYVPGATPFDPSMSATYDPLIAYHLAQLEPQLGVGSVGGGLGGGLSLPAGGGGVPPSSPLPSAGLVAGSLGAGSAPGGYPSGMALQNGMAP